MSFFDDFLDGLSDLAAEKAAEKIDSKADDFCRLTGADRDDVNQTIVDICDAGVRACDKVLDFLDSL